MQTNPKKKKMKFKNLAKKCFNFFFLGRGGFLCQKVCDSRYNCVNNFDQNLHRNNNNC